MFKKLFVDCVMVLAVVLTLTHFSDLHAGQTYFYDTKGNRISEEEYKKIIKKKQRQNETPTAASKQSETESPATEITKTGKDTENDKAEEDSEIEADNVELEYQAEISSETLFRAFSRDTDQKNDALVLPGYQYLRMDFGALDQEGLSFHIYGWGRYDFNDEDYYDDNPDGELMYGYLEYNQPDYGINLTLGRQHVMAGIINNSIDGFGIKSALTPYFKFSAYGGSPVGLSSENGRSGDSIWGGRVAAHRGADYEFGLSYKKKNSDGEDDEEMAGFDLFANLPYNINFLGFSSYNLDTNGWGEHSYEILFDVSDFGFRPFYQRYRYEDFFNTKDNSANPFRFLADTDEILSVLGSDVTWHRFSQVDLGAKVNHFNYDKRDEAAFYFEGNVNWHLNSLTQIGGQLGRMNGDTSETSYLLSRAFFYKNMPSNLLRLGFISGDVMYVHYDEQIYGQDYSLWLSLGGGFRFLEDAMEIKLSGDWSNDPYFDSDLRGLLKIQYNY